MEPDQAFLEYAVKALADHRSRSRRRAPSTKWASCSPLTVHPEDMGKIIGKSGKTAEALRILLRVVGMKGNAR